MTHKTTLAVILAATAFSAATAQAAHNNPWAGEEDVVLSIYHDANQAKSIGTPGEDEMRGVMSRNANGKLGGTDRATVGHGGDEAQGGNGGHGGSGGNGGKAGNGGKGANR